MGPSSARSSRWTARFRLLGINWGEVGFLADLEPSEALEFVQNLAAGFSVEERMRITLSNDSTCLGTALNEALIVTSRPGKNAEVLHTC